MSELAARPASPWGLLLSVVALDITTMLPVGLLGMFATQVRRELDVSSGFIGIAVGAFFLAGSLTAASAGMLIDRVGHTRVVLAAGTSSIVAQLLAASTSRPAAVVALSAVSGGCFAMMMPTTNAALGNRFPDHSRTLAVCIKQSAVPMALLLGALATPGLAALGGWRTAQIGSSALLLLALVVFLGRHALRAPAGHPVARASASASRAARRRVLRVAAATMLASCLAGSLTAYTSLSLHVAGLTVAVTALVITVGNVAGIGVRLTTGVVAQRRRSGSWLPVGAMMVAGAAGACLLATGSAAAVIVGTLVAFALGWGWTGLTYALVLESNRDDPGVTGATLQAGGMLGSATGPFLMAALISHDGLAMAWTVIGAVSAAAGIVAAWPELAQRGRA